MVEMPPRMDSVSNVYRYGRAVAAKTATKSYPHQRSKSNNSTSKKAKANITRNHQQKPSAHSANMFHLSWYLNISSCFFLLPGAFAHYHGYHSMCLISLVTTLVSINYWRKPKDGWRRNLDLIVAKVSFLIYFSVGLVNIRDTVIFVSGLFGALLMISAYSTGLLLFDLKSPLWVFAHMLFHFFVACGQVLVIYGSFII